MLLKIHVICKLYFLGIKYVQIILKLLSLLFKISINQHILDFHSINNIYEYIVDRYGGRIMASRDVHT